MPFTSIAVLTAKARADAKAKAEAAAKAAEEAKNEADEANVPLIVIDNESNTSD